MTGSPVGLWSCAGGIHKASLYKLPPTQAQSRVCLPRRRTQGNGASKGQLARATDNSCPGSKSRGPVQQEKASNANRRRNANHANPPGLRVWRERGTSWWGCAARSFKPGWSKLRTNSSGEGVRQPPETPAKLVTNLAHINRKPERPLRRQPTIH